jgi:hypothetical protein
VEATVPLEPLYDNGQTFERYATFAFFKNVKQNAAEENLYLTLPAMSNELLELGV